MERASSGSYGMADYLSDLTKLSTEVTNNTMAVASMGAQIYRSVASSDGQQAGGAGGQQVGQPAAQPAAPPAVPRPTSTPSPAAPNPAEGSDDVSG